MIHPLLRSCLLGILYTLILCPSASANHPIAVHENGTPETPQTSSAPVRAQIVIPTPSPTATPCENRPPAFESLPEQVVTVGEHLYFQVAVHDPDNDNLDESNLIALDLPPGAEFLTLGHIDIYPFPHAAGEFNWTPAAGQAGLYLVVFQMTDPAGALAQMTVPITVLETSPTPSLLDQPGVPPVVAYPNPAKEDVAFTYKIKGFCRVEINVYRPDGERVARILEEKNGGDTWLTVTTPWKAAGIAPGVYVCRIVVRDENGRILLDEKTKVALIR